MGFNMQFLNMLELKFHVLSTVDAYGWSMIAVILGRHALEEILTFLNPKEPVLSTQPPSNSFISSLQMKPRMEGLL